jgi:hypothetical protein
LGKEFTEKFRSGGGWRRRSPGGSARGREREVREERREKEEEMCQRQTGIDRQDASLVGAPTILASFLSTWRGPRSRWILRASTSMASCP